MIKYLAVIFMLGDHINNILFDNQYFILTFFGRLVFPLFAYLSVNAYIFYTRDKLDYISRILLFSSISILPYMYAFNVGFLPLNILFAISFGLIFIFLYEKKLYFLLPIPFMLSFYTAYGVDSLFMFISFYFFLSYKKDFLPGVFLIVSLLILNPPIYVFSVPIVMMIIFADILFKFDFKSSLNKYAFYLFYPAHILILGLLK